MKYKLINSVTKTETLCAKVTIDGFDYYINNDKLIPNYYVFDPIGNRITKIHLVSKKGENFGAKKVIATNNPNIDIPKVVDEVGKLAEKFIGCKYEDIEDSIDQIGYDSFKRGYNKSQETHPFSEEDMIEFGEMVAWNMVGKTITESFVKGISKELLQFWKEQRPKKVYYVD